jgi:hypothetical protein
MPTNENDHITSRIQATANRQPAAKIVILGDYINPKEVKWPTPEN